MKIIFYFLLFIAFPLYASFDEECEQQTTEAQNLAKDFSLPNCYKQDYFSEAKKNNTKLLCNDCKKNFEKLYPGKINPISVQEQQRKFLDAAIKEYKKNVIDNLMQATKISSLPHTGSQFKKSIQACGMKSKQKIVSDCKSPAAKKFLEESNLITDFSEQIAGELAQILSGDQSYKSKKTLLKRNEPACFIPEKDIIYIANSTIEDAFTPALIDTLKNIDASKFSSIEDLFLSDSISENYDGDISQLVTSLGSHPYFAEFSKSPKSFIAFFKTIKSPSSVNNLRTALYNEKNGNDFDAKLAQNCTSSYDSLLNAICNENFEKGNLDLKAFENFEKINDDSFLGEESEFASTDDLIKKNLSLLAYCENKADKTNSNLSEKLSSISVGLTNRYQNQSLALFQESKYQDEIGNLRTALCSTTDSNCVEGTFICTAYKKLKNTKEKGSFDSKLANSSNKEGNALLRSMIGDPKNLDPKTKEILVLQGILPKDDGTLVAQAEIPERQPGYFNQAPASQSQAKVTTPVQPAAASARTASSSRSQQSASNDSSNWTGQPTTSSMPDLSDYYKNQKEMDDIESEIMRRLSSMPEQKPASKAAAKKIARDAYAKTGRSMPTALEDYYANRIMGQNNAPSVSGSSDFEDAANTGSGPRREASVSNTDSAAEKWKKDGMNRALADMHGAKQAAAAGAGRNPASTNDDANAKALTTVALNIAEDPKVTLSQSLAEKINKNDPETQLLQVLVKNKSNFILQMKSVNFKVIFDDQKKLRLLVDSGDPKEAERLRPQLELFFKRLSAL